jgi:hypothetical protein
VVASKKGWSPVTDVMFVCCVPAFGARPMRIVNPPGEIRPE